MGIGLGVWGQCHEFDVFVYFPKSLSVYCLMNVLSYLILLSYPFVVLSLSYRVLSYLLLSLVAYCLCSHTLDCI